MTVAMCVHCGRQCGTPIGGMALVRTREPLCHPKDGGRPDCHHMVTVYGHDLYDCARCAMEPYIPLTQEEMHDALIETLHRLDRMVRDCLP